MSRMTIRTYRITPTGQRVDLAPPQEVEQDHRHPSPLSWSLCTCSRCGPADQQARDERRRPESDRVAMPPSLSSPPRSPTPVSDLSCGA